MLNRVIAGRDSLKLDTLENGFDSIEIRLWIGYRRTDTIPIITLKNVGGRWSAFWTEAVAHFNLRQDSIKFWSQTRRSLNFTSNPNKLIAQLTSFGIFTLPDCTKLEDYNFPFDGDCGAITFEISSKALYRLFFYSCPKNNQKLPQARQVSSILAAICEEFSISPQIKL